MRPDGPIFDKNWRESCKVTTVSIKNTEELIKQHYLSMFPKQVQICFGLKRKEKIIGVITFSQPVRELINRFGDSTWELSRLYIIDKVPKNAESFFIGAAIRYIKKEYKSIRTLISFADPSYGHSGIVYKASNWKQVEHASKNLFVYNLVK